jgi:hypothetical protein
LFKFNACEPVFINSIFGCGLVVELFVSPALNFISTDAEELPEVAVNVAAGTAVNVIVAVEDIFVLVAVNVGTKAVFVKVG